MVPNFPLSLSRSPVQLAKSSHKHANIVVTKARASLLQARASFQQARLSVTGQRERAGSVSAGMPSGPGDGVQVGNTAAGVEGSR